MRSLHVRNCDVKHAYGAMFLSTFPARKHGIIYSLGSQNVQFTCTYKGCRMMVPSIFPVVVPTQIPYAHGMSCILIAESVYVIMGGNKVSIIII